MRGLTQKNKTIVHIKPIENKSKFVRAVSKTSETHDDIKILASVGPKQRPMSTPSF